METYQNIRELKEWINKSAKKTLKGFQKQLQSCLVSFIKPENMHEICEIIKILDEKKQNTDTMIKNILLDIIEQIKEEATIKIQAILDSELKNKILDVLEKILKSTNLAEIEEIVDIFEDNEQTLAILKERLKIILTNAIISNNPQTVKKIFKIFNECEKIEILQNVLRMYTNRNNALMLAISKGNLDITTEILSVFENNQEELIRILTDKNIDGNNALMLAISKGNLDITTEILSVFENNQEELIRILTDKNIDGNNALMLAISKGNLDIATEIISVFENNQEELIRILTDKNIDGNNALMLAISKGNLDIIKIIIQKSKKIGYIKEECNHILISAIINNDIATVQLLIKANVDLNFRDNRGNTPLFFAKLSGNTRIIKLLKEQGAKCIEYNIEKIILEAYFGYGLNKKIDENGKHIQYLPSKEEDRAFKLIRLQNLFFMAQALNDKELLEFFSNNGITEDKVKNNELFSGDNILDYQKQDCFRKFINFDDTTKEEQEAITLNQKLIEQHLERIIPIILSEISNYQIKRFQNRLVPFIEKLKEFKIEGFYGDIVKYNIETAISTLFNVNSTIDQKWNAKETLAQNLKLLKDSYKKVFGKDDLITDGYLMLSSICSAKSKDELINTLFSIVRYQMQLMYSRKAFEYKTCFSAKSISMNKELELLETLSSDIIDTILEFMELTTITNENKIQIIEYIKNNKNKREILTFISQIKEISDEERRNISKFVEKIEEISEEKRSKIITFLETEEITLTEKRKILEKLLTINQNGIGIIYRGIQTEDPANLNTYFLHNSTSIIGRTEFNCFDQGISNSLYYICSHKKSCILAFTSSSFSSAHSFYFVKQTDNESYIFCVFVIEKDAARYLIRTDRELEVAIPNLPVCNRLFNIIYDKDRISLSFSTETDSICFKYKKNNLIEFLEKVNSGLVKIDEKQKFKNFLISLYKSKSVDKKLEESKSEDLIKKLSIILTNDVYLTREQIETIVSLSNNLKIERELLGKKYNAPLWTIFIQNLEAVKILDIDLSDRTIFDEIKPQTPSSTPTEERTDKHPASTKSQMPLSTPTKKTTGEYLTSKKLPQLVLS